MCVPLPTQPGESARQPASWACGRGGEELRRDGQHVALKPDRWLFDCTMAAVAILPQANQNAALPTAAGLFPSATAAGLVPSATAAGLLP